MKRYGIYLAYAPMIDLGSQGLGRHLAALLGGAQKRGDISFVIACPSWTRKSLISLCKEEGIDVNQLEIIGPARKPALLMAYEWKARSSRKGPSRILSALADMASGLRTRLNQFLGSGIRKVVGTRDNLFLFSVVILSIFTAIVLSPLILVVAFIFIFRKAFSPASRFLCRLFGKLRPYIDQPKQSPLIFKLYRLMEEAEIPILQRAIEQRSDILAWYSPTAFWPHFNQISKPKVMCVPDVVFLDFPAGFSMIGEDRFLTNFRQVEQAIKGGEHFITYSNDVKWKALVDTYNIDPEAISVIPHGANRLDDLVMVTGFPDNEMATDRLCRNLLNSAFGKSINPSWLSTSISSADDIRFLFYASQFRPNKNVITLLRAYNHLLKKRYAPLKLILTGDPRTLPEIQEFIIENNLENDVLCLHGLSLHQLAACYRLADLAINPSLSEGGFPFTFTEAVSLGTPTIMARIPVTEEIIIDPELAEKTLFDPYDWQKLSIKIEWALANRDELYGTQRYFYEHTLKKVTWEDVANKYISTLERISQ